MRIAHVMGYYAPRLGYQENWLPFEQRKLGHEVSIVAGDRYHPVPDYELTMGRVVGPRLSPIPGLSHEDGVAVIRLPVLWEAVHHSNVALRGLPETIRMLRPDVVHLHGVTSPTTHQVVFSTLRLPLVADSHTCYFNLEPYHLVKRLYYRTYRHGLGPLLARRIRLFLAIAEEARDVLVRECGIPADRIVLNYLGADHRSFRFDPERRAQVRASLGLPDGGFVFAYAGKFTPNKDVAPLIEAFGRLSDLPAYLLLIGNGAADFEAELRACAAGQRNRDRIVFHDLMPNRELPAFYSAADAGVWPGNPSNTIQEGAMCGLPVVIHENRITNHVVAPGTGALFPRGDIEALSHALRVVATDRRHREEVRQRVRAHAEMAFSWMAIAADAVRAYERAGAVSS